MEQNLNTSRSLIVDIDEAKTELIQCVNHIINQRGVPCYFIEPILADILIQVKSGAQNELASARMQAQNAETTPKE